MLQLIGIFIDAFFSFHNLEHLSSTCLIDYKEMRGIYIVIRYIWRGTPGDVADVPATKLPFTYLISTLSFPLQSCRSRYNCVVIFLKELFFASASDSSGARVSKSGTWNSRDVGFVTWRSSSYVLSTIVPKQGQSGCGLPDARPRPCPH